MHKKHCPPDRERGATTQIDVHDFSSATIHEAVADYFVVTKNNDPCVGRSICPADSAMCWQKGSCLRSAENTLTFDDFESLGEAHRVSQILSGMLWDLGKENNFSRDQANKVVFRSINYLLKKSNYTDFVKALMMADLELFDGQHSCLILEQAQKRKFDNIASIDCKQFQK